jgi:hypothetical protein
MTDYPLQIEELKARIRALEQRLATANLPTPLSIEAYETVLLALMEHNCAKNQIIRELMGWIESEFDLETRPPDRQGRELWNRALEAIK